MDPALTEGREALRFRPWSIKFILSQQTNPCSAHLCSLAGALRVVPFTRCAVVRERGLSSGSVGFARWYFGDSNTVVSSRWGLGGLRHFSGALRPFRHSSRGLPSGSAIRCPSSLSCAGAHYSGFVGRASSMWLLGEYGILLFCSPGFWVVGVFLRALSSSGG